MRNLKRTLSLVMAMALIVGMMVVSASAVSSDFNDSAEITNTEAVDVMTAIGVFEGTDKGAFNPTGILTREQAAKIVAVMLLGEEDANKLSTNSTTFKDVAANRWSAGYIFFTFRITDKDAQDVALSIKNSKGNLMYKEDAKGVTTGFHYFYVQVIGEGINNSSKGYEMSDKALVDGTYTWTIVNTTTGDELIGGTFTIR